MSPGMGISQDKVTPNRIESPQRDPQKGYPIVGKPHISP